MTTAHIDGWDRRPCGYLRLSEVYDDPARLADERGWPVVREPSDHLGMVTHPERIAHLIVAMVETLGTQS